MIMRGFTRKIGLATLSIFLFFGSFMSFPVTSTYAAVEGDFEYEALSGVTAIITGYTGDNGVDVVIPNSVGGGLTVVEIGEYAFSEKQLISIMIPEGVTTVGNGAFERNNLTDLTLPNSLATIGSFAFYQNELSSLTIPDGVTAVGQSAFESNNLTDLTLPGSLATIETNAFYNNELSSLTLPDGVTTVGQAAFRYNMLTNLTLPNSLTTIESSAFMNNELSSLTIPEGVTTVGPSAFEYNNLTNLTLPGSLTTIESSAFKENELSSLTIPEGVTTVGPSAFEYNNLTNLTLPGSLTAIESSAFKENELSSLTIPEGVTTVGTNAFQYNNLTNLTLPNSLITIEPSAFKNNELVSLTIPEGVTTVGPSAFEYNNLTNLTLPGSLTTIETTAFKDNKLVSLTIPASVQTIEPRAFSYNPALLDVLILNTSVEFAANDIFYRNSTNLTLYSYASSNSQTFASDNNYGFQTITPKLLDLELNIDGFSFDPEERTFNVMTNANAVIVTPTPVVPFSIVKVNEVLVPYGEGSLPIELDEELATITVVVEAPDNSTEEYTLELSVDQTSPSIDLTANPTMPTMGNVTIKVDTDGTGSAIDNVKWAAGNQVAAYFETSGQLLTGNSFDATSNGIYTVYARDEAGNEAVETITINNIDRSTSSVDSTPPLCSEDCEPRTIISIGPGVIIIKVAPRDIKELPKDNGRNKKVVNLPDDVWEELPKLLDDDRPVIQVVIDDTLPDVELRLLGKQLEKLRAINPNVEFDMQLNGSSFQLKVNVLDLEQLATRLGIAVEELNVVIKISALTGDTKEDFLLAADEQGMTVLSQVIEFQLFVSGDDEWVEITDFGGTYMTKSIVLDKQFANRNYMAVLYDPDARTFTYVPAVMDRQSNGQQDAVIQMPHNSIYAIVETDRIEFADMQGHWAESEVEKLGSKRIVRGITINDYAPNRNITRAEFASILVRALGIKTNHTGAGDVFKDVAISSWYSAEVEAAFRAGLVNGISSTHFAPDALITREQIAVMLMNAQVLVNDESNSIERIQSRLTSFTDASEVSLWARDAISEAVASELIQGMSTDRLAPAAPATRAQATVMLHRFMVMFEFLD
ncbi:leucine-rich repeat protein [Paenibacillus sp. strain BS8-2]